jgi:protein-tyrosine phosphatase
MRAYRRGNWKILRLPPPYGNDRWQLYDLTTDPGETVDLATRFPDRLEQLVAAYKTYVSANGVVSPNQRISYAMAPQTRSQNTDYRQIVLEGQSNFRDIGGYMTADGRSVAMGRLFRSGELPKLTDQDVSTLQEIGIKTVVNFLADQEIRAHGRDRLPVGTRQVSLPIEPDDGMIDVLLQARKTADFSRVSADLNPEFHRRLVNEAKAQYAALLREIIRQKDPLVFHCSHGIHRTGTATAILLWSLGVPWETVRADYLLSNHYRRAEVSQRTEQLRQMAAQNQSIEPADVDMTNINAFYNLQGSYIDAARDQILKDYGSIGGYLTRGLELTDDEIDQLRERLLN